MRGKGRISHGHGEDPAVLLQFVGLFESRGWLNRTVRVRYRGASYRLYCSDEEFLAYRINENNLVSPGVPGWPVCMVREDRVFNDSEMCPFPSPEPGAGDWLRCIADEDFEVI